MERMTTERELLELEKRYWRAIQERDADTVMRLADDPCIIAGAQGMSRVDRKALGEMVRTCNYQLDRFDVQDGAEVRMLGDDVAILAYKVCEELTVDGEKVSLEAADSSTWVHRDGKWLCAMHTESLSGDPFGRDRGTVTTPPMQQHEPDATGTPSPPEVARHRGARVGGGPQADRWMAQPARRGSH